MSLEPLRPTIIKVNTYPDVVSNEFLSRHLRGVDPLDVNRVEHAFGVAVKLHRNQPQRDTGGEFIEHPLMVMKYLSEAGCSKVPILVAALLHDGPEDNITLLRALGENSIPGERMGPFGLLSRQFGRLTAETLSILTKEDPVKQTKRQKDRAERRYRHRLLKMGGMEIEIEAHADARLVKLADRIHNVRTLPWRIDNPELFAKDRLRAERKVKETRDHYDPIFRRAVVDFPIVGGALYGQLIIDLDHVQAELRNAS
jgi:(p)ppGpp synthase/HD superfamily hydrolase